MDTGRYLPGYEHRSHLGPGINVDTDFAGMVHYPKEATDELVLIARATV
jgi:hypothetical protein